MPLSIEEFLTRLSATRLLSSEELSTYYDQASRGNLDWLIDRLLEDNKITWFQAQVIMRGENQTLVLGNYILLDELGEGGMGNVYQARHRRMERIVAIKVLKPKALESPEQLQRFQREVVVAAKLDHPNIVTAYDADEYNGIHFLVMQYVDGIDLSNVVWDEGPLSVKRTVDYISQAACGLQYAHQQQVMHRDIKPENLLLSNDGQIKILDMGLASITGDLAGAPGGLTKDGQVLGTADFMSPEHAENMKLVDARSDIYSLGCTMWFLLTARPVFITESFVKCLVAHQSEPVPSLSEIRSDVPPELNEIFGRMLAKNPNNRYQSMADVRDALATVVQDYSEHDIQPEAKTNSAKNAIKTAETKVTPPHPR